MQAEHHGFEGVVPRECAGERLDVAASRLVPDVSRGRIAAAIRSGALLLDGRRRKPAYRVLGGERISIRIEEPQRALGDLPQPVPFEVAYEDEHLIVVDKPPGLVVHPGAGNADGTLVNGLLARRPDLAALPRAGIVHRLDKDTSGLMVVAASEEVRRVLLAEAARRGLQVTEPEEVRILREWELRAQGWAGALGFGEGMAPDAVADQALAALGSTGQAARIAREAIGEAAAALLSAYPVEVAGG